jgi:hypothetical protein
LSETIINQKAQELRAKTKLLGFMQLQTAIGAQLKLDRTDFKGLQGLREAVNRDANSIQCSCYFTTRMAIIAPCYETFTLPKTSIMLIQK